MEEEEEEEEDDDEEEEGFRGWVGFSGVQWCSGVDG